jgi:Protein of unknown function (DUF2934)
MAKAKEPKTTSSKTAKPAAARTTPTASHRPAKVAPDAPSSNVIQTGASSGGLGAGHRRAQMSPEEVYRLIQETAYYKAKARGFAPGHEVQDWIEAEAEVRMRLDERA